MKLNKYLKAVQALQAKAINRNDIKMFEVDIRAVCARYDEATRTIIDFHKE